MSDMKKYLDMVKAQRAQNRGIVTESEARSDPFDPKKHQGPRIVHPDDDFVQAYREGQMCGNCAKFRLRAGQEAILKSKLWESLFSKEEFRHKPEWYQNPHEYGLCDEYDGHLTSARAPCMIPRHLLDSAVAGYDPVTKMPHPRKDEPTKCPHYRKSGSFRRQLKVFQGGGNSYDPE